MLYTPVLFEERIVSLMMSDHASERAHIEAPPELCYSAVLDVERYPGMFSSERRLLGEAPAIHSVIPMDRIRCECLGT